MNQFQIYAFFVYCTFHLVSPNFAQETVLNIPGVVQENYEILFIGSSYFGSNGLPGLFQNLADASNKEVYIDKNIPSGLYLTDHVNNPVTDTKIRSRKWDYVVLQGVGRLVAYPEEYADHSVHSALVKLNKKIKDNWPDTKVVFCLPWAYEDGMIWAGWPDTYEDMQIKIKNNAVFYAKDIGLVIAPVGWAWYAVLKELDYPLHYLHTSDWNHPSLKGSYLMACVIYSTIFQKSSVGIPYNAGLPDEEALHFQTVGSEVVFETPELWNIQNGQTSSQPTPAKGRFSVSQNYPNPANDRTAFQIEIERPGLVEYVLLDRLGRNISAPQQELKQPGKFTLELNCQSLPDGIYWLCARHNANTRLIKMIILH